MAPPNPFPAGADGWSAPEPLSLAQERALRLAHIAARRWLEAFAIGPVAVMEAEHREAEPTMRRQMAHYIDGLLCSLGPNLVTEILDTYHHELTVPRTPRAAMTDAIGGSR